MPLALLGDVWRNDVIQVTDEHPEIEAGTVIDQYTIIKRLACGGMSEVYLATDMWLERKVALKIILPQISSISRLKKKFWTEVQMIAQLNHPHVVAIYGVGEYRGRQYAALQYVDGPTLRMLMESELSVTESLRVSLSIAEALKSLHSTQIAHCDLKPENIMVPRDGILRVVDFGLATRYKEGYANAVWRASPSVNLDIASVAKVITIDEGDDEEVSGTPLYMAPEQWKKLPLSGATDIWALGMMMYEMFTGTLPYEENEFCVSKLSEAVCAPMPLPRLNSVSSDIPPSIRTLVDQCMCKNPKRRPSAKEVARILMDNPLNGIIKTENLLVGKGYYSAL